MAHTDQLLPNQTASHRRSPQNVAVETDWINMDKDQCTLGLHLKDPVIVNYILQRECHNHYGTPISGT